MVAHLLTLRLLVMRNTLARSPWQLVAVIIGALYGVGLLIVIVVGVFSLSFAPVSLARTIVVLVGSATIVGWFIVPLLTSGIDQTLSVSRLRAFPIPPSRLVFALTVCGILGVPGLVTMLAGLATGLTWWHHPLIAVASVVSAVVAVLTCVCGSRMIESLNSGLASRRRYRELTGVIILIPLVLLGPLITALTTGLKHATAVLPRLAEGLAWTPLGAPWAVPSDLARGQVGRAGLEFTIAVATLAVVATVWRRSLATALVSTAQATAKSASPGAIGLFGVFPPTPTGAVAARSLTYWMRDPRYSRQLILIPLFPILLLVYSRSTDTAGLVDAAAPIVALLVSLSIFSDLSFDSTAFASHVAAGISGRADRAGRVIAVASFGLPVVVLICIGSAWYGHNWSNLPALLGLSLGVFLTGLGLSSYSSARIIIPVPAPGDSPFAARPGAGLTTSVTTFATWGVLLVLALPEIVLAVVSGVFDLTLIGWLALVLGLVLGSVVLLVGVRLGGRELERRAPELLARLRVHR